jgi:hypothetical protein
MAAIVRRFSLSKLLLMNPRSGRVTSGILMSRTSQRWTRDFRHTITVSQLRATVDVHIHYSFEPDGLEQAHLPDPR